MTQQGSADIGVTGLAVMGRNLARNLARHGHVVSLHNRSPERTRSLVKEHGDEGTFVPAESMKEFVASLGRPRAIIVMVKAGEATDAVIDELVPLLDEGDIVIDCGNAHFMDTRRREAALRVFVTARAHTQAERLVTLLRHQEVACKARLAAFDPAWLEESVEEVQVVVGPLARGVLLPADGVVLVTEEEIFGSRVHRRRDRARSDKP